MFSSASLSVTGIMFEILGSFLLAVEAWGIDWIKKYLNGFVRFSNFVRKNVILTLLLTSILCLPFFMGALGNNKFSGLILPSAIFMVFFATIIDDAANIEKRVAFKIGNRSIGPHGFIMLLIGNILQLISSIIN